MPLNSGIVSGAIVTNFFFPCWALAVRKVSMTTLITAAILEMYEECTLCSIVSYVWIIYDNCVYSVFGVFHTRYYVEDSRTAVNSFKMGSIRFAYFYSIRLCPNRDLQSHHEHRSAPSTAN